MILCSFITGSFCTMGINEYTVDWEIFAFLMFALFNFRCLELRMKIKSGPKFNAYSTISEVARSKIQCLES